MEIQIKINGDPRNVSQSLSVLGLLESLALPSLERGVAVCVNGEVVRRSDWPTVLLQSGDELEIVHATQGG